MKYLFIILIFFCSCSPRTYSYRVHDEIKTVKVKSDVPQKIIAITAIFFFIGFGSTNYFQR
jgi:hypothetical protein